ncbi:hypothetical protein GCM10027275_11140 [Rhabdobacter roseus]|uniref:Heparinase II/III-like C-terminal domain-containing protein n=1 Tax=Rhabdobacter roseus TaxID=1655419 RepID=A0A840THT0_9BACT|nr:heparinase II/III family protein [Rhabdobacter roseus]MBB5283024.1 hypothetical protein [Rhabdobacter roseus]
MKKIAFLLPLLAWLLVLQVPALAQKEYLDQNTKVPAHPRLLLLKGEEAAIQKTIAADKTWEKMHQAILTESDALLEVPPVERIQIGRRLLDKSREALRRIFFLSYAHRLSGQDKYLKRAEKEMLAIAAFSDWNPSHFLDVAEMTMALAIGYDWLYEKLPEASRRTIREAILKKGIEPSMDPKHNAWLRVSHNWNQVCNAGMTYGALAIYEDEPALARRVINRAIQTIVLPMEDYAPGGAYPEGYGYWGYGTSFNVMFNSAIEKAFGNDFGLNAQPGFLQTGGYLRSMTGPTGVSFNYSDAGGGGGLHPAMFWFAEKAKDPSLLWVEKDFLMNRPTDRHLRDRLLPAIMIWSAGVGMDKITAPKDKIWVGAGKSPVALMRTSWTDPNAIYLGLKAGSPSVNHAHMDIGSFVLDADGVRWAMDFGAQSYESLESKGMNIFGRDQNAQRWTIFRYVNQTHNTLTINDQLQRVAGDAPITGYSDAPNYLSATTDLTPVYKGQLARAQRGVAIVDQQYVVVRDELEALSAETTLRWTMLTPADVKIVGKNKAELTKDGKKLILEVQEPATITMKTWSTEPTTDYDAPNPGTTLVGFEAKLPAGSKTALTVLLVPEKAKARKKVLPLAQWKQQSLPTR